MATLFYNNDLVKVHKLLGRRFNNPHGESILKLASQFIKKTKVPTVLDLGCGRGESSIWLAREAGARVVAVDPSAAMILDAGAKIRKSGLAKRIELARGTVSELRTGKKFDLILLLDVLSWVDDKSHYLKEVAKRMGKGSAFVLTDYYVNKPRSKTVARLCGAWGISTPPKYDDYSPIFEKAGLSPLIIFDSTNIYYEYWKTINRVCLGKKKELKSIIGSDQFRSLRERIVSILSAVKSRDFGHITIIANRRDVNN